MKNFKTFGTIVLVSCTPGHVWGHSKKPKQEPVVVAELSPSYKGKSNVPANNPYVIVLFSKEGLAPIPGANKKPALKRKMVLPPVSSIKPFAMPTSKKATGTPWRTFRVPMEPD